MVLIITRYVRKHFLKGKEGEEHQCSKTLKKIEEMNTDVVKTVITIVILRNDCIRTMGVWNRYLNCEKVAETTKQCIDPIKLLARG